MKPLLFILILFMSGIVYDADAQERGDLVFSVGAYPMVRANEAEYGKGAVVTIGADLYLTDHISLSAVHKSRYGTGWPHADGMCSDDVNFCESTFDAVGLKFHYSVDLF